ncbi:potassium channel subfamily K member 15-like [Oculina patagonica]
MNPLFKAALLRIFAFLSWAFFSTWLFVMVENTEKDHEEEKYHLLSSLYDSMAMKYNMTIEEFNNFSSVAFEAMSEPEPRWTFFTALDFVLHALTTIGYGYIAPQTPSGQMLCIFVSLVGIPITLLALKSVGELIAKLVNGIVITFERKILKRAEPKQVETKSAVILFLLMVLLIVVNGLLAMEQKDWTFVEGVYFWFVTLSTIGFGDYVIMKEPQRIKQLQLSVNSSNNLETDDKSGVLKDTGPKLVFSILFTLYTVLGLCIVASVLNAIMAAIEEQKWRPRCPGCVPRKTQDHADTLKQRGDLDMTSLSTENVGFRNENIEPLSLTHLK